MTKKFTSLFLAIVFVLSLAACSKAPEPETEAVTTAAVTTAAPSTEAASAEAVETKAPETEAPVTEAAPETNEDIWKDMDGVIFGFTSGVGAWETTIEIAADGSFEGEFYDMNMGETGEGYENGTLYECIFTGKFAEPEIVDEHTLITKVAELDYEIDDEYIEEEMLCIPTSPYGLSKDDEVTIYLPGTKTEELSEEFMSWAYLGLPRDAAELTEIFLKVGADEFCFFPDHYAMGDAMDFYTGDGWDSDWVAAMKEAYVNQKMPDEEYIPYVYTEDIPASPYESVTLANLQGNWVNTYSEGGSTYTELLTVNGIYGKMVTLRDGEVYGVWNGDGICSIEDRSDEGKCPAFRINEEDGTNLCTIYIRWVNGSEFYDGGFLNSWYYVNEDEPDTWLYDTVTLENLDGVWYCEYYEEGKRVQTVLIIDGSEATLFETVDGVPAEKRNGKGTAKIEEGAGDWPVPKLIIDFTEGVCRGTTEKMHISSVDYGTFYDAEFRRWYEKVF